MNMNSRIVFQRIKLRDIFCPYPLNLLNSLIYEIKMFKHNVYLRSLKNMDINKHLRNIKIYITQFLTQLSAFDVEITRLQNFIPLNLVDTEKIGNDFVTSNLFRMSELIRIFRVKPRVINMLRKMCYEVYNDRILSFEVKKVIK